MGSHKSAISVLFVVDVNGLVRPEDIITRLMFVARIIGACSKAASCLCWGYKLVNLAVPVATFEEALRTAASSYSGLQPYLRIADTHVCTVP